VPYLKPSKDKLEKEHNSSFFSYSPLSNIEFQPKDPTVHQPISISKAMQKSLRWITLGGQYDWTNKVYPKEAPPDFPPDIGDLLLDLFPEMKPQAAIVNIYSPGDTLSLHRDVSEESDKGLVSISIGCDCLFVIGHGLDGSGPLIIRLRSGDGVFMCKESRFAWHGVPKILPDTCPSYLDSWPAESGLYEDWCGWMKTKRINLNVRQMHD
jgi:alkylated DNA repair protein alkB homolog 1